MTEHKNILDMACGSRMFWFDRENKDVLFGDIRQENHTLCDGRDLTVAPDVLLNFADLPFRDESFQLVVFDPPHLDKVGTKSWMFKKYGALDKDWKNVLKDGFKEAFRVLKNQGTLIFKWNETQIKTSEILKLADKDPLFGHISGKRSNTHWICFMKTA